MMSLGVLYSTWYGVGGMKAGFLEEAVSKLRCKSYIEVLQEERCQEWSKMFQLEEVRGSSDSEDLSGVCLWLKHIVGVCVHVLRKGWREERQETLMRSWRSWIATLKCLNITWNIMMVLEEFSEGISHSQICASLWRRGEVGYQRAACLSFSSYLMTPDPPPALY